MTTDVERFDFTGSDGQTLSGRIHLPAVDPIACAVFAHCFTCSKHSRAARHISAALAEKGIATLRFDFAGTGRERRRARRARRFAHDVSDDIAAAARVARSDTPVPELLVGHSLGGVRPLLAAAARDPRGGRSGDHRRALRPRAVPTPTSSRRHQEGARRLPLLRRTTSWASTTRA